MIYDVAVIGGGATGMMAAIHASKSCKTILLEKMPKLGRKLLLTGKGRCNLTTKKNVREIVQAFGPNGKFLYGPLSRFSNDDTITFFGALGVDTVVERGDRVFPASNEADTVLKALIRKLEDAGTEISYNFEVSCISQEGDLFKIASSNNKKIQSKRLIIATGGKSYPGTGSTGDGYKFAESLGHTVIQPKPALVPLIVKSKEIRDLAGLSLKNVELKFYLNKQTKPFMKRFGEMLFTHQGVSGPIVLDSSKEVGIAINKKPNPKIKAVIDLKPALTEQKLKARIDREIIKTPEIEFATLLKRLLPKSLIETAIKRSKIDRHIKIAVLTKIQKQKLIEFLKYFDFFIDDTAPIENGVITSGGVNIKEIDPRTMESKLVPGLYFAGEVIDLDGPTGGFNLQEAWTTGYVAGITSAASLNK